MNYKTQLELSRNFPIVESFFGGDTGMSCVRIQTPEGIFTGIARVHPYDMENKNYTMISGNTIAHLRAFVSYFKYRKRLAQNAYKELQHIYCTNKKNTTTSNALWLRMKELEEEIKLLKQNIDLFNSRIESKIKTLEEYYEAKNK